MKHTDPEPITGTEDILDSRGIIARIEHLEGMDVRDEDEEAELTELRRFVDESSGYYLDWKYGETLIADHYFKDYAQELAADIGAIDRNASWPASCIDWDEAAELLQQDYTSADLFGHTYWGR